MNNITIRKATINDIADIAQVHVQCWQETYTDLLPAELVASNSIEKRQHMWTQFFAYPSRNEAYVACADGHVIGFCSWVTLDEQINLMTLYVLRAFHGQKIGTKLMDKVLKIAAEQQVPIHLWVLNINHKACMFYKNLGFEYIRDEAHEKSYPGIIDSLYVLSC